jgi:hypothetical protein
LFSLQLTETVPGEEGDVHANVAAVPFHPPSMPGQVQFGGVGILEVTMP